MKGILLNVLFLAFLNAPAVAIGKEGPNGGHLLKAGDFALELTLFEQGVPPEYRAYAYRDGEPLDPAQVDLTVTLERLGARQERITFQAEGNYLLGQQPVTQPHSFNVTVEAGVNGEMHQWYFENHQGRTRIPRRLAQASGLVTEVAAERTLTLTREVTGRVVADPDNLYRVSARYPGRVERMLVSVGDAVKKGQPLARVEARESLTVQTVVAPADGVVTERFLNVGATTDHEPIVEIGDFSSLWVELHLFSHDLRTVSAGQTVRRKDGGAVLGEIDYLYPRVGQASQVTRARVVVSDPPDDLRPGMLIGARVVTGETTVPLAVRREAVQSFRDKPVVFARFGEFYEARPIKPGLESADYVEVTGGLEPGTEYVTENSFLLKADVLKDGATHSH